MFSAVEPSSLLLLGLLQPPRDLKAADSAGAYVVVIGVCFAIGAAWCLREAIRRRDALPVVMLLGGALAVGGEPIVDNLGAVWYPADNPVVPYTAMGVPQPLFLQLGYPLFWGAIVYVFYELLRSGRVRIWPLFLFVFALDLFVEILGVRVLDVGVYYGPAPYRLLGFPLWWAPVNAAVAIVGARALLATVPLLPGWRVALLLPLAPGAFVGTHAMTAWPIWIAMQSDVPQAVRWLAATFTLALVALLIALIAATMPGRVVGGRPVPSTGDHQ
jgi:hypothetical protein